MSKEDRQDIKFYTSLLLGFALLVIGTFIPPTGYITSSMLIASGMILSIAAFLIGLDLTKVFKEIRLLREGTLLTEEERKEIINDLTKKEGE